MQNKREPDPGRCEESEPSLRSDSMFQLEEVLSLDAIMERVRAEVIRRRTEGASSSTVTGEPVIRTEIFHGWLPASAKFLPADSYVLADFLRFDDRDLVESTYRLLLRRPVDPAGGAHFLECLRSGSLSKVEFIGVIRFSEEGRRQNIHVDGLLLPLKIHNFRRIPFVGSLATAAIWVLRLPPFDMRSQRKDGWAASEIQRLADVVNHNLALIEEGILEADVIRSDVGHLSTELRSVEKNVQSRSKQNSEELRRLLELSESIREDLSRQLSVHKERVEAQAEQLVVQAELLDGYASSSGTQAVQIESRAAQLAAQVNCLEVRVDELGELRPSFTKLESAVSQNKRSTLDVQRLLITFLDGNQTAVESVGAGVPDPGLDAILNAQYVSFEDAFRGARQDIKQRAAHYLPILLANNVKNEDGLVLDLGCGRGEWLEVLSEQSYRCRGVDLNNVMLEESIERGFDVVESDALVYLRGLGDNSLATITSMHVVEHLPHEVLIRLLDEALRVLRPGGVLILETPNPENLTVGSCWFYLDPTHRNPIPPVLLQWLVEERGFARVEIERLSEYRSVPEIDFLPEDMPGAKQINQIISLMTAPPDYAVIAIKPMLELVNYAPSNGVK